MSFYDQPAAPAPAAPVAPQPAAPSEEEFNLEDELAKEVEEAVKEIEQEEAARATPAPEPTPAPQPAPVEQIPQPEQLQEQIQQQEVRTKPVSSSEDDKIKEELASQLNSLKFFSDQTRFNSIIYEGMSLMMQKLNDIEVKLNAK